MTIDGRSFTIAARGKHQAGNAMFAWAIARELKLDLDAVAAALGKFVVPGGRGELKQHDGLTIVNDSYNANPQSFATAIALAQELRPGRRLVFVAGSMRELGSHAESLHREVAPAGLPRWSRNYWRWLVTSCPRLHRSGNAMPAGSSRRWTPIRSGRRSRHNSAVTNSLVLKGSRGATLERILPPILARARATT